MSRQIINVEGTSIEIWDYNAESKSLSNKRTTTAANEAAQQGRVPVAQDEVNRRFAEVSAAEARQRQAAEEANQHDQDHTIEDEDTEETFSTYEPFHFKRGQVRSTPRRAGAGSWSVFCVAEGLS